MLSEFTRREALAKFGIIAGSSLLASSFFESSAHADGERQDTKLTVQEVSKNINVIMGAGGNIALFASGSTALLVDSGYKQFHESIISEAAKINPAPVSTLINTHWHSDHTDGNAPLGAVGVRIIGHENTRKRLNSDQNVEFLNMKSSPSPKSALPVATFTDGMCLFVEDEEIELTHVAPAHTDSDIIVHFKSSNVIHAGDLFFNGFYPFIDYSSKGWLGGMVAAADIVLNKSNATTKIIPGHGPLASRKDFLDYRNVLADIFSKIAPMVKAGKTVEQIVSAKPTAKYDEKWGKGFIPAAKFIPLVYTGIVRHENKS